MDTASPTPERITVRLRSGITSGTVVWRKPGKVRVALRTGQVRTFGDDAIWTPKAHNLTEAQRREMFPRTFAKLESERPTAEMLDFSVEAMGYCHGVNAAAYHARVWP